MSSHQTALALHDLSDVLTAKVHVTLPEAWRHRRLRVPEGVSLHYGTVLAGERHWVGPVPVTSPLRSLQDCAEAQVAGDLLRNAALDALGRGLVARQHLTYVEAALEPVGGLDP